MFATLEQSWEFTKMSLRVLRRCRRLLIFPIFSGAAAILVSLSFAVPVWQTGALDVWLADEGAPEDIAFYVTAFLFYFCNYFVIIFFNSALVIATLRFVQGEDPSVRKALGDATRLLPQIFGWAIVSAVVGLILNALERNRKIGHWVSTLIGSAWTALTYFVVPVMVVERMGPVASVRRSVDILRENWGTALVGNFSIGFMGFLLMLPLFLLAGLLAYVGFTASTAAGMVLNLGLAGILVIVALAADSALGNIFRAILYTYSTGMELLPPEMQARRHAFRNAFVSSMK